MQKERRPCLKASGLSGNIDDTVRKSVHEMAAIITREVRQAIHNRELRKNDPMDLRGFIVIKFISDGCEGDGFFDAERVLGRLISGCKTDQYGRWEVKFYYPVRHALQLAEVTVQMVICNKHNPENTKNDAIELGKEIVRRAMGTLTDHYTNKYADDRRAKYETAREFLLKRQGTYVAKEHYQIGSEYGFYSKDDQRVLDEVLHDLHKDGLVTWKRGEKN